MRTVTDIRLQPEFDELLAESHRHPVLLFKYSPTCPVSHEAAAEFRSFLANFDPQGSPSAAPTFHQIDVIAARPLARGLAQQIGVQHESPQAILFRDGKPVWHASHGDLYREAFAALF